MSIYIYFLYLETAAVGTCIAGLIPSVMEVKEVVKEAFKIEKMCNGASSAEVESSGNEKNEKSQEDPPVKRRKVFMLLSEVAAGKAKSAVPASLDFFQELYSYVNQQFTDKELEISPLSFWKSNWDRFPTLSIIARKVLGLPASSGSVERLFSVAGGIKRVRRSSIKVDTMERLLCLRDDMLSRFK